MKNIEEISRAIRVLIVESKTNQKNAVNAMAAYGALFWVLGGNNKEFLYFENLLKEIEEYHKDMLNLTNEEYNSILERQKIND